MLSLEEGLAYLKSISATNGINDKSCEFLHATPRCYIDSSIIYGNFYDLVVLEKPGYSESGFIWSRIRVNATIESTVLDSHKLVELSLKGILVRELDKRSNEGFITYFITLEDFFKERALYLEVRKLLFFRKFKEKKYFSAWALSQKKRKFERNKRRLEHSSLFCDPRLVNLLYESVSTIENFEESLEIIYFPPKGSTNITEFVVKQRQRIEDVIIPDISEMLCNIESKLVVAYNIFTSPRNLVALMEKRGVNPSAACVVPVDKNSYTAKELQDFLAQFDSMYRREMHLVRSALVKKLRKIVFIVQNTVRASVAKMVHRFWLRFHVFIRGIRKIRGTKDKKTTEFDLGKVNCWAETVHDKRFLLPVTSLFSDADFSEGLVSHVKHESDKESSMKESHNDLTQKNRKLVSHLLRLKPEVVSEGVHLSVDVVLSEGIIKLSPESFKHVFITEAKVAVDEREKSVFQSIAQIMNSLGGGKKVKAVVVPSRTQLVDFMQDMLNSLGMVLDSIVDLRYRLHPIFEIAIDSGIVSGGGIAEVICGVDAAAVQNERKEKITPVMLESFSHGLVTETSSNYFGHFMRNPILNHCHNLEMTVIGFSTLVDAYKELNLLVPYLNQLQDSYRRLQSLHPYGLATQMNNSLTLPKIEGVLESSDRDVDDIKKCDERDKGKLHALQAAVEYLEQSRQIFGHWIDMKGRKGIHVSFRFCNEQLNEFRNNQLRQLSVALPSSYVRRAKRLIGFIGGIDKEFDLSHTDLLSIMVLLKKLRNFDSAVSFLDGEIEICLGIYNVLKNNLCSANHVDSTQMIVLSRLEMNKQLFSSDDDLDNSCTADILLSSFVGKIIFTSPGVIPVCAVEKKSPSGTQVPSSALYLKAFTTCKAIYGQCTLVQSNLQATVVRCRVLLGGQLPELKREISQEHDYLHKNIDKLGKLLHHYRSLNFSSLSVVNFDEANDNIKDKLAEVANDVKVIEYCQQLKEVAEECEALRLRVNSVIEQYTLLSQAHDIVGLGEEIFPAHLIDRFEGMAHIEKVAFWHRSAWDSYKESKYIHRKMMSSKLGSCDCMSYLKTIDRLKLTMVELEESFDVEIHTSISADYVASLKSKGGKRLNYTESIPIKLFLDLVEKLIPQIECILYLSYDKLNIRHWHNLSDTVFAASKLKLEFPESMKFEDGSVLSNLDDSLWRSFGDKVSVQDTNNPEHIMNISSLAELSVSIIFFKGLNNQVAAIRDVCAQSVIESILQGALESLDLRIAAIRGNLSGDWLKDPSFRDRIGLDLFRISNILGIKVFIQYALKTVLVLEHISFDMNLLVYISRLSRTKILLRKMDSFFSDLMVIQRRWIRCFTFVKFANHNNYGAFSELDRHTPKCMETATDELKSLEFSLFGTKPFVEQFTQYLLNASTIDTIKENLKLCVEGIHGNIQSLYDAFPRLTLLSYSMTMNLLRAWVDPTANLKLIDFCLNQMFEGFGQLLLRKSISKRQTFCVGFINSDITEHLMFIEPISTSCLLVDFLINFENQIRVRLMECCDIYFGARAQALRSLLINIDSSLIIDSLSEVFKQRWLQVSVHLTPERPNLTVLLCNQSMFIEDLWLCLGFPSGTFLSSLSDFDVDSYSSQWKNSLSVLLAICNENMVKFKSHLNSSRLIDALDDDSDVHDLEEIAYQNFVKPRIVLAKDMALYSSLYAHEQCCIDLVNKLLKCVSLEQASEMMMSRYQLRYIASKNDRLRNSPFDIVIGCFTVPHRMEYRGGFIKPFNEISCESALHYVLSSSSSRKIATFLLSDVKVINSKSSKRDLMNMANSLYNAPCEHAVSSRDIAHLLGRVLCPLIKVSATEGVRYFLSRVIFMDALGCISFDNLTVESLQIISTALNSVYGCLERRDEYFLEESLKYPLRSSLSRSDVLTQRRNDCVNNLRDQYKKLNILNCFSHPIVVGVGAEIENALPVHNGPYSLYNLPCGKPIEKIGLLLITQGFVYADDIKEAIVKSVQKCYDYGCELYLKRSSEELDNQWLIIVNLVVKTIVSSNFLLKLVNRCSKALFASLLSSSYRQKRSEIRNADSELRHNGGQKAENKGLSKLEKIRLEVEINTVVAILWDFIVEVLLYQGVRFSYAENSRIDNKFYVMGREVLKVLKERIFSPFQDILQKLIEPVSVVTTSRRGHAGKSNKSSAKVEHVKQLVETISGTNSRTTEYMRKTIQDICDEMGIICDALMIQQCSAVWIAFNTAFNDGTCKYGQNSRVIAITGEFSCGKSTVRDIVIRAISATGCGNINSSDFFVKSSVLKPLKAAKRIIIFFEKLVRRTRLSKCEAQYKNFLLSVYEEDYGKFFQSKRPVVSKSLNRKKSTKNCLKLISKIREVISEGPECEIVGPEHVVYKSTILHNSLSFDTFFGSYVNVDGQKFWKDGLFVRKIRRIEEIAGKNNLSPKEAKTLHVITLDGAVTPAIEQLFVLMSGINLYSDLQVNFYASNLMENTLLFPSAEMLRIPKNVIINFECSDISKISPFFLSSFHFCNLNVPLEIHYRRIVRAWSESVSAGLFRFAPWHESIDEIDRVLNESDFIDSLLLCYNDSVSKDESCAKFSLGSLSCQLSGFLRLLEDLLQSSHEIMLREGVYGESVSHSREDNDSGSEESESDSESDGEAGEYDGVVEYLSSIEEPSKNFTLSISNREKLLIRTKLSIVYAAIWGFGGVQSANKRKFFETLLRNSVDKCNIISNTENFTYLPLDCSLFDLVLNLPQCALVPALFKAGREEQDGFLDVGSSRLYNEACLSSCRPRTLARNLVNVELQFAELLDGRKSLSSITYQTTGQAAVMSAMWALMRTGGNVLLMGSHDCGKSYVSRSVLQKLRENCPSSNSMRNEVVRNLKNIICRILGKNEKESSANKVSLDNMKDFVQYLGCLIQVSGDRMAENLFDEGKTVTSYFKDIKALADEAFLGFFSFDQNSFRKQVEGKSVYSTEISLAELSDASKLRNWMEREFRSEVDCGIQSVSGQIPILEVPRGTCGVVFVDDLHLSFVQQIEVQGTVYDLSDNTCSALKGLLSCVPLYGTLRGAKQVIGAQESINRRLKIPADYATLLQPCSKPNLHVSYLSDPRDYNLCVDDHYSVPAIRTLACGAGEYSNFVKMTNLPNGDRACASSEFLSILPYMTCFTLASTELSDVYSIMMTSCFAGFHSGLFDSQISKDLNDLSNLLSPRIVELSKYTINLWSMLEKLHNAVSVVPTSAFERYVAKSCSFPSFDIISMFTLDMYNCSQSITNSPELLLFWCQQWNRYLLDPLPNDSVLKQRSLGFIKETLDTLDHTIWGIDHNLSRYIARDCSHDQVIGAFLPDFLLRSDAKSSNGLSLYELNFKISNRLNKGVSFTSALDEDEDDDYVLEEHVINLDKVAGLYPEPICPDSKSFRSVTLNEVKGVMYGQTILLVLRLVRILNSMSSGSLKHLLLFGFPGSSKNIALLLASKICSPSTEVLRFQVTENCCSNILEHSRDRTNSSFLKFLKRAVMKAAGFTVNEFNPDSKMLFSIFSDCVEYSEPTEILLVISGAGFLSQDDRVLLSNLISGSTVPLNLFTHEEISAMVDKLRVTANPGKPSAANTAEEGVGVPPQVFNLARRSSLYRNAVSQATTDQDFAFELYKELDTQSGYVYGNLKRYISNFIAKNLRVCLDIDIPKSYKLENESPPNIAVGKEVEVNDEREKSVYGNRGSLYSAAKEPSNNLKSTRKLSRARKSSNFGSSRKMSVQQSGMRRQSVVIGKENNNNSSEKPLFFASENMDSSTVESIISEVYTDSFANILSIFTCPIFSSLVSKLFRVFWYDIDGSDAAHGISSTALSGSDCSSFVRNFAFQKSSVVGPSTIYNLRLGFTNVENKLNSVALRAFDPISNISWINELGIFKSCSDLIRSGLNVGINEYAGYLSAIMTSTKDSVVYRPGSKQQGNSKLSDSEVSQMCLNIAHLENCNAAKIREIKCHIKSVLSSVLTLKLPIDSLFLIRPVLSFDMERVSICANKIVNILCEHGMLSVLRRRQQLQLALESLKESYMALLNDEEVVQFLNRNVNTVMQTIRKASSSVSDTHVALESFPQIWAKMPESESMCLLNEEIYSKKTTLNQTQERFDILFSDLKIFVQSIPGHEIQEFSNLFSSFLISLSNRGDASSLPKINHFIPIKYYFMLMRGIMHLFGVSVFAGDLQGHRKISSYFSENFEGRSDTKPQSVPLVINFEKLNDEIPTDLSELESIPMNKELIAKITVPMVTSIDFLHKVCALSPAVVCNSKEKMIGLRFIIESLKESDTLTKSIEDSSIGSMLSPFEEFDEFSNSDDFKGFVRGFPEESSTNSFSKFENSKRRISSISKPKQSRSNTRRKSNVVILGAADKVFKDFKEYLSGFEECCQVMKCILDQRAALDVLLQTKSNLEQHISVRYVEEEQRLKIASTDSFEQMQHLDAEHSSAKAKFDSFRQVRTHRDEIMEQCANTIDYVENELEVLENVIDHFVVDACIAACVFARASWYPEQIRQECMEVYRNNFRGINCADKFSETPFVMGCMQDRLQCRKWTTGHGESLARDPSTINSVSLLYLCPGHTFIYDPEILLNSDTIIHDLLPNSKALEDGSPPEEALYMVLGQKFSLANFETWFVATRDARKATNFSVVLVVYDVQAGITDELIALLSAEIVIEEQYKQSASQQFVKNSNARNHNRKESVNNFDEILHFDLSGTMRDADVLSNSSAYHLVLCQRLKIMLISTTLPTFDPTTNVCSPIPLSCFRNMFVLHWCGKGDATDWFSDNCSIVSQRDFVADRNAELRFVFSLSQNISPELSTQMYLFNSTIIHFTEKLYEAENIAVNSLFWWAVIFKEKVLETTDEVVDSVHSKPRRLTSLCKNVGDLSYFMENNTLYSIRLGFLLDDTSILSLHEAQEHISPLRLEIELYLSLERELHAYHGTLSEVFAMPLEFLRTVFKVVPKHLYPPFAMTAKSLCAKLFTPLFSTGNTTLNTGKHNFNARKILSSVDKAAMPSLLRRIPSSLYAMLKVSAAIVEIQSRFRYRKLHKQSGEDVIKQKYLSNFRKYLPVNMALGGLADVSLLIKRFKYFALSFQHRSERSAEQDGSEGKEPAAFSDIKAKYLLRDGMTAEAREVATKSLEILLAPLKNTILYSVVEYLHNNIAAGNEWLVRFCLILTVLGEEDHGNKKKNMFGNVSEKIPVDEIRIMLQLWRLQNKTESLSITSRYFTNFQRMKYLSSLPNNLLNNSSNRKVTVRSSFRTAVFQNISKRPSQIDKSRSSSFNAGPARKPSIRAHSSTSETKSFLMSQYIIDQNRKKFSANDAAETKAVSLSYCYSYGPGVLDGLCFNNDSPLWVLRESVKKSNVGQSDIYSALAQVQSKHSATKGLEFKMLGSQRNFNGIVFTDNLAFELVYLKDKSKRFIYRGYDSFVSEWLVMRGIRVCSFHSSSASYNLYVKPYSHSRGSVLGTDISVSEYDDDNADLDIVRRDISRRISGIVSTHFKPFAVPTLEKESNNDFNNDYETNAEMSMATTVVGLDLLESSDISVAGNSRLSVMRRGLGFRRSSALSTLSSISNLSFNDDRNRFSTVSVVPAGIEVNMRRDVKESVLLESQESLQYCLLLEQHSVFANIFGGLLSVILDKYANELFEWKNLLLGLDKFDLTVLNSSDMVSIAKCVIPPVIDLTDHDKDRAEHSGCLGCWGNGKELTVLQSFVLAAVICPRAMSSYMELYFILIKLYISQGGVLLHHSDEFAVAEDSDVSESEDDGIEEVDEDLSESDASKDSNSSSSRHQHGIFRINSWTKLIKVCSGTLAPARALFPSIRSTNRLSCRDYLNWEAVLYQTFNTLTYSPLEKFTFSGDLRNSITGSANYIFLSSSTCDGGYGTTTSNFAQRAKDLTLYNNKHLPIFNGEFIEIDVESKTGIGKVISQHGSGYLDLIKGIKDVQLSIVQQRAILENMSIRSSSGNGVIAFSFANNQLPYFNVTDNLIKSVYVQPSLTAVADALEKALWREEHARRNIANKFFPLILTSKWEEDPPSGISWRKSVKGNGWAYRTFNSNIPLTAYTPSNGPFSILRNMKYIWLPRYQCLDIAYASNAVSEIPSPYDFISTNESCGVFYEELESSLLWIMTSFRHLAKTNITSAFRNRFRFANKIEIRVCSSVVAIARVCWFAEMNFLKEKDKRNSSEYKSRGVIDDMTGLIFSKHTLNVTFWQLARLMINLTQILNDYRSLYSVYVKEGYNTFEKIVQKICCHSAFERSVRLCVESFVNFMKVERVESITGSTILKPEEEAESSSALRVDKSEKDNVDKIPESPNFMHQSSSILKRNSNIFPSDFSEARKSQISVAAESPLVSLPSNVNVVSTPDVPVTPAKESTLSPVPPSTSRPSRRSVVSNPTASASKEANEVDTSPRRVSRKFSMRESRIKIQENPEAHLITVTGFSEISLQPNPLSREGDSRPNSTSTAASRTDSRTSKADPAPARQAVGRASISQGLLNEKQRLTQVNPHARNTLYRMLFEKESVKQTAEVTIGSLSSNDIICCMVKWSLDGHCVTYEKLLSGDFQQATAQLAREETVVISAERRKELWRKLRIGILGNQVVKAFTAGLKKDE